MPNATQIMRNGSRLLAARDKLFAEQDAGFRVPLRAEIEASWRRSMAHGVRPDRFSVPAVEAATWADVLLLAAGPVADAVGTDLAGTGVSLLVSDQGACIIDRRVPDAGLRTRLDRIGLAPGFHYGEEAVGTTAISVALQRRGPALVAAGEHYSDTLTPMVCAAAPVTDPGTGRVLGTVGLACLAGAASPLMVALVKRAARDIEQRLADGVGRPAGDGAGYGASSGWDSLTAPSAMIAATPRSAARLPPSCTCRGTRSTSTCGRSSASSV